MTEPRNADVPDVIHRELRLLRPAVRRSAQQVEEALHPDFVEFGSSGRRWDRLSTIVALGDEPADGAIPTVSDMRGEQLADDVVHLTYLTEQAGRRVWRSSLWCRRDGDWRMYFHQGTPQP